MNSDPCKTGAGAVALALLLMAAATPVAAQQAPAPPVRPGYVPGPAQAPRGPQWSAMPRMVLEQNFAGPLQDTLVQRWRDPVDGTVCYLYLPISVRHGEPTAQGYVEYGAANIGAISCVAKAPGSASR